MKLRSEKGEVAGVDNIPAELVQADNIPAELVQSMIDIFTKTCNKIWDTGDWPLRWTQLLIITLP